MDKLKIIFLLVLVFVLSSCYHVNKNEVQKPNNFIPRSKMVDILMDMQLIEGVVSYERLSRVRNPHTKDEYFQRILLQYGITTKQLRNNLNYYNSHYNLMAAMYNEILLNLNEKETFIKAEIQKKEKEKKLKYLQQFYSNSPTWTAHIADSLFEKAKPESFWYNNNTVKTYK